MRSVFLSVNVMGRISAPAESGDCLFRKTLFFRFAQIRDSLADMEGVLNSNLRGAGNLFHMIAGMAGGLIPALSQQDMAAQNLK